MTQLMYALLGALLWPTLVGLAWLWGSRRGALSGFWLQLTYGPEDEDMQGRIWSVEIVRVRQLGHHLRGSMWRVYPAAFERRWHFVGRRDSDTLRGLYTLNRGTGGGSGLFHLLRLGEGPWSGQFLHSFAQHAGKSQTTLRREDYALEWVRLSGLRTGHFTEWLAGMAPRVRDLYPPHLRRSLWGDADCRKTLALRLAAVAALFDSGPLLALQRADLTNGDVADEAFSEIRRNDIVEASIAHSDPDRSDRSKSDVDTPPQDVDTPPQDVDTPPQDVDTPPQDVDTPPHDEAEPPKEPAP
jgi:hypothetical protein